MQRILLAAVLLGAAGWGMPARAEVTLQDQDALMATLTASGPCCVIDARTAKARAENPMPEALPYRRGIKIRPTGTVAVIASDDVRAVAVGKELASAYKGAQIVAVRGGVKTWRKVESERLRSGLATSFVIPTDTCQQGPPLQTLKSDNP